jgi:uncharacterized protein
MLEIERLTPEEARVLGTLIEKSQATPDYYPMTVSALKAACNQKTCREPVSQFDENILLAALAGLKRKTLVVFIPYSNQPNHFKYRHFLDDIRYDLSAPQLALLSVLLLRGAQTLNELKLRTASQHAFADLESIESTLVSLNRRASPLAERLEKRPGWKEPRWRHLLYDYGNGEIGWVSGDGDLAQKAQPEVEGSHVPARPDIKTENGTPGRETPALSGELEGMRSAIAVLQTEMADLRREVEQLKSALGG